MVKVTISKDGEAFLEKKMKKRKGKLNLVLHLKSINKNCYTKYDAEFTFETDDNYLRNIDKISEWKGKIDIYLDPAVESILEDKNDLKIILAGKLFKYLTVENVNSKIKYGCKVSFGKDVITSGLNINK
ncbi:MAG TPA: hypothetical protein VGB37_09655 [Candidatus Lokiarchaeia archaeon]